MTTGHGATSFVADAPGDAGRATAFVAGATGYTGREVVRQLAARGMRVIAHVRPDSPQLDDWRRRFRDMGVEVDATPWRSASMEDAMRRYRPDQVYALLGTTKKRARAAARAGDGAADYEAVDYGMTHMLLDAVTRAAPRARFVYLSSIGARADTRNEYLRARGRIEAELQSSGLWYVVARPGIISGPDREESRPLEHVAAVLSRAAAVVLGDKARPITGAALASALIDAASDPAARGAVLDAAAITSRSRCATQPQQVRS